MQTRLTLEQRRIMSSRIIEAMREHYEAHGETGDWADGERYLRDDASDAELREEYAKWLPGQDINF